MSETQFWYFEIEGGGVESGDTTPASAGAGSSVPEGARVVGTLDELNTAIDEAVDLQVDAFEQEQTQILLDVAKEMDDVPPEPDNPAPMLIRHNWFNGMGPSMFAKLKAAGVTTLEQIDELGVDGLVGLKIKGLTEKKAELWVEREILGKHR